MTTITTTTAPTSMDSAANAARKQNELSKDQFLQLLTAQMRHQDPLSPMDNSQMLAQLAQFAQLEQTTNLAIAQSQAAQASTMTQAVSFIGKTVTYQTPDLETGEMTTKTGVVQSVVVEHGQAMIRVGDDIVLPWSASEITA